MLRADNIICGTSTTGTGTLTLAASPTPPGGVDFDVWARATGIGFVNSAAILVSYSIIEYTTSAFTTAKSYEKGVGTLTLGGSSGITNATLARTTKQSSATSLDSQPATQNITPATGISIGTAANTLVFIGSSATDLLPGNPYFNITDGDALGVTCPGWWQAAAGGNLTSGTEYWRPFMWMTPMLAKRISVRVTTAYTGGTSNLYGRIYAVGTNGRPGKLLIDFGVMGTANSSLASSNANISSALHTNGFFLNPGWYYLSVLPIFSGGSGTPNIVVSSNQDAFSGQWSQSGGSPLSWFTSTGGNATAPDSANTTGFSGFTSGNGPGFWLKST